MSNSHGLLKIEKYFKMSFEDIITKLHWDKQRSIKSLSDECGVSRDTFQKQAKKHNLKLRSNKEACKLTPNKGENHWVFGLRKETSSWAKMHSDRMKKNNPCFDLETLYKKQKSSADTFRLNPWPQEKQFAELLDELNIKYISQYPFKQYIIDFLLIKNKKRIAIEIDSTDKWGKEQRFKAEKKDELLNEHNFKVIRINKRYLKNKTHILNILISHNIISHF